MDIRQLQYLVALAREYHCLPVAIVLDMPERLCQARNDSRPDRAFGPHVIRNHARTLRQSLRGLQREGFRHVFVMHDMEAAEAAVVTREPLYNNKKSETGPFDIVADVHGCYEELCDLLGKLGYKIEKSDGEIKIHPPEGRKAVFLGDLVDRGPRTPDVLRLVMSMAADGSA